MGRKRKYFTKKDRLIARRIQGMKYYEENKEQRQKDALALYYRKKKEKEASDND